MWLAEPHGSRGVWGHAPPGKFGILHLCRSILVHSGACLPITVYFSKGHYVEAYKNYEEERLHCATTMTRSRGALPPYFENQGG